MSGLFLLSVFARFKVTGEPVNVLGWLIYLVIWVANMIFIYKYYFLSDQRILNLKQKSNKVSAEIIEEHQLPFTSESTFISRRLLLRFTNLSGTKWTREFILSHSKF